MSVHHVIRDGDSRGVIRSRLTSPSGAGHMLEAASVRLRLQNAETGTFLLDAAATIEDPDEDIVSYEIQSGDIAAGVLEETRYFRTWQVTYDDGGIQTFPSENTSITIVVPNPSP